MSGSSTFVESFGGGSKRRKGVVVFGVVEVDSEEGALLFLESSRFITWKKWSTR